MEAAESSHFSSFPTMSESNECQVGQGSLVKNIARQTESMIHNLRFQFGRQLDERPRRVGRKPEIEKSGGRFETADPHAIKVESRGVRSDPGSDAFHCFQLTFGLVAEKERCDVKVFWRDPFADDAVFAQGFLESFCELSDFFGDLKR
jgi:hypothetical protein